MNNEQEVLCDTILHRSEVQENLEVMASRLRQRGFAHDRTKLQAFEFDAFVSTRDKFKKADYGSKEYQECTEAIRPAIDHHYANNRHHTDYHSHGINDMNLMDIMEMLADWKAANRRSPNKELEDTLEYAFKKYGIEPQLQNIIHHRLTDLGWI